MKQNTKLSSYLNYSTICMLFSEALFLRVGFDLKIFYAAIVINLGIVTYTRGIFLKRSHLYMLGFIFLSGLISGLVGMNKFSIFLFQIIGITLTSIYFFQFFRLNKGKTTELFILYSKFSFFMCLLGVALFVIHFALGEHDYRLKSIMLEPAHFCGIVLPAFYFYLKNFKSEKFKFSIVFLALILSFSSVGYLGIMACLVLMKRRFNLIKLSFYVGLAGFLGFVAYIALPFVKMRVDDTFSALSTFEVENVNLSSYALISNLYVSLEVFKHSPLWGNGLGSHEVSHSKYIGSLPGSDTFEELMNLNAADGNSLLIRVLSDFGLIGIAIIFVYIYKYYTPSDSKYIISRSILVYFFYKLLREGHYFSPEMYFFVVMFYFIYLETKTEILPSEKVI